MEITTSSARGENESPTLTGVPSTVASRPSTLKDGLAILSGRALIK